MSVECSVPCTNAGGVRPRGSQACAHSAYAHSSLDETSRWPSSSSSSLSSTTSSSTITPPAIGQEGSQTHRCGGAARRERDRCGGQRRGGRTTWLRHWSVKAREWWAWRASEQEQPSDGDQVRLASERWVCVPGCWRAPACVRRWLALEDAPAPLHPNTPGLGRARSSEFYGQFRSLRHSQSRGAQITTGVECESGLIQ